MKFKMKFKERIKNIRRFMGEKWDAVFKGNPLRAALVLSLIVLIAAGGILAAVLVGGGSSAGRKGDGGFYQLLREYDQAVTGRPLDLKEIETLSRELDRLEKRAGGVESWLSVLKRRRQLARLDSYAAPAWRQSARRAALAFPWSEPVAAVAAEALIHEAAITDGAEAELRSYLPLLADSLYRPMRLGIHVLLGDLKSPEQAAALLPPDWSLEQFPAALWRELLPSSAEAEALATDFAIIKALRGDTAGAVMEMQGVLSGYAIGRDAPPSNDFVRFAAEFFYDFADLSRSAELFSRLPGVAALSRQADALWLAGYSGNARIIWTMLSAPEPEPFDPGFSDLSGLFVDPDISARSLYNLALTAETPQESAMFLERLIALPAASESLGQIYGRIRYSRLLDAPMAIAFLEIGKTEAVRSMEMEAEMPMEALIDLQILRRRMELDEPGRLAAETWLLLGRYPQAENLYCWAAWYFSLQRNYGETAVLLKTIARHQFSGEWIHLYEALQFIREDNLDRAAEILSAIPAEAADWPVAANMGRILEARIDPARAIVQYETVAAALQNNREAASRIQVRIARCLKSLGRINESRRVLEYALDLNPSNLNARLELSRLE